MLCTTGYLPKPLSEFMVMVNTWQHWAQVANQISEQMQKKMVQTGLLAMGPITCHKGLTCAM